MSDVLAGLAWFDFLKAHGLEWLPVYWDVACLAIFGIGLAWIGIRCIYEYLKDRRQ